MILSLKDFLLTNYNINGDIILYRDEDHRKKKMCEYLAQVKGIPEGQDIHIYSDGAYALYMAKAFPNNKIISHYSVISPDYGDAMVQQQNLELVSGYSRYAWNKLVDDNLDWYVVDQHTDTDITEYYKGYFSTIVEAVKDYHIDAFCEYSHTGQTLKGFIESELVDWKFILGQIQLFNNNVRYLLKPYTEKLKKVNVTSFKTYELYQKIEIEFPWFGNIYEATRSISGAMKWLETNPGKSVLIYVGDEFKKLTSKFNDTSLSANFEKESYLISRIKEYLKDNNRYDITSIKEYFSLLQNCYSKEYLDKSVGFLFHLIMLNGKEQSVDSIYNEQFLLICKKMLNISEGTLLLMKFMLDINRGNANVLGESLKEQLEQIKDFDKIDPFVLAWAFEYLKITNIYPYEENLYLDVRTRLKNMNDYRKSIGLMGVWE